MTSEAEFLSLDRETSNEDVRRAASAARTEDEYLEALREAGSLSAGIAIVYEPRRQGVFIHDEAFRRRVAELLAGGLKINGRWTNVRDFDEPRTI
jgi:hypothetical protein